MQLNLCWSRATYPWTRWGEAMIDAIYQFDHAVIEWIQLHLAGGWLDPVMAVITGLGNAGFIWLLSGIIFLFFKRTRPWGIIMLAAVAATFILGDLVLKPIVSRARPFIDDPTFKLLISPPSGYSFPSGHSGSSFAAAVSLFTFDKRFGTAALCLAALIAFSRVYLYVHYPSDVLTGAALGTCIGLLAAWGYSRWEKRNRQKLV